MSLPKITIACRHASFTLAHAYVHSEKGSKRISVSVLWPDFSSFPFLSFFPCHSCRGCTWVTQALLLLLFWLWLHAVSATLRLTSAPGHFFTFVRGGEEWHFLFLPPILVSCFDLDTSFGICLFIWHALLTTLSKKALDSNRKSSEARQLLETCVLEGDDDDTSRHICKKAYKEKIHYTSFFFFIEFVCSFLWHQKESQSSGNSFLLSFLLPSCFPSPHPVIYSPWITQSFLSKWRGMLITK